MDSMFYGMYYKNEYEDSKLKNLRFTPTSHDEFETEDDLLVFGNTLENNN